MKTVFFKNETKYVLKTLPFQNAKKLLSIVKK